ncbi:hypothetical protein [Nocardia otitidiscaviarum]|uniref:hypothetical protein n=1 Tax=Nocardia otitidiscaviarum TaxID=1823 RepID=UPI0024549D0D|nr:hypothetical protein [Nocardia otitidiscaviarum]
MTTYRRFVEANEHEGESWNFWLQVDGNMTALAILGEHLDGLNGDLEDWDEPPFVLKVDQLEGHEVDLLVRYGDEGYMKQHNKIDGSMRLPKNLPDMDADAVTDLLYKGGIERLFRRDGE